MKIQRLVRTPDPGPWEFTRPDGSRFIVFPEAEIRNPPRWQFWKPATQWWRYTIQDERIAVGPQLVLDLSPKVALTVTRCWIQGWPAFAEIVQKYTFFSLDIGAKPPTPDGEQT